MNLPPDFNHSALAEAAREMAVEDGTPLTLDRAVLAATDLIEHCDFAGISLVHARGVDTPAASSEELRLVDQLQHELGEGPCVDGLRRQDIVSSGNLSTDDRWPAWGQRISSELGIHSTLCFRLYTTETNLGALNLYAKSVDAFDDDDVLDGVIVATHAAVALAAAIQEDNLHKALGSRTTIGVAIGIVRERYGLTSSDQAFEVLKRVASEHNIKLNRIAAMLVEGGTLPSVAQASRLTMSRPQPSRDERV